MPSLKLTHHVSRMGAWLYALEIEGASVASFWFRLNQVAPIDCYQRCRPRLLADKIILQNFFHTR
jgi:hypothetical protein